MLDRDLYEQAKKILRWVLGEIDFPKSGDAWTDSFILSCHECGHPFASNITMGVVAAHFETQHPEVLEINVVDPPIATLDLVWIAEGPPPEPGHGG